MGGGLSRAALLRGRWRDEPAPIRPPWALPEESFREACRPAGTPECVAACPQEIIKTGDGSHPVVDFSGDECTFCVACVEACPTGALTLVAAGIPEEAAPASPRPPWSLKAVIADTCLSIAGIACRVCGEQCPEDAISFRIGLNGKATPIVDRNRCTGCGACFGPCPVDAITMRDAALEAAA